MKKLLAVMLSLVLLLSGASALAEAPAEAEIPAEAETQAETPAQAETKAETAPAESIVAAAESLLFRTENVTLNGQAEFTLDGTLFKSGSGTYIRDYENSFWQLKLHTPGAVRPDSDEDLESGYTIIGNSEKVYVIEVVRPGVYKMGYIFPRTTVLRQSVQVDLLAALARDLAKQADALLGEGAFAAAEDENGGCTIHVVLDENVPGLVNTALTVVYQTVASRYFGINFDQVVTSWADLSAYYTVTQGLLYTTNSVTVRKADITVSLDAAGELQAISGLLGVDMLNGNDGRHEMDINFSLAVTDRGASKVDEFDPDQYGVVPKE